MERYLPQHATIIEVGPRDGFQSIHQWIATKDKLDIITALLESGVDYIEATSFVSPKAIEQMKDAREIVHALREKIDMRKIFALVPNAKGVERAWESGVENVTMVISASEAHNMSNVRKTPTRSLEELAVIRRQFPKVHVKVDIATAFGCPFIGDVPEKMVTRLVDTAVELEIFDLALCDTTGVANPVTVAKLLQSLIPKYAHHPMVWSMHFHNTRGLAAANILTSLSYRVDRFESAIAGLGGCPFAPGASGNIATEDLVFMLHDMGVQTHADLGRLVALSGRIPSLFDCTIDSKINSVTMHKQVRKNS